MRYATAEESRAARRTKQQGYMRAYCVKARTERRAFLAWLKSRPCVDCGAHLPSYCLDFDHRPGEEKHFEISRWAMTPMSMYRLSTEVQKCDLVCANCHRLRTHGERRVVQ